MLSLRSTRRLFFLFFFFLFSFFLFLSLFFPFERRILRRRVRSACVANVTIARDSRFLLFPLAPRRLDRWLPVRLTSSFVLYGQGLPFSERPRANNECVVSLRRPPDIAVVPSAGRAAEVVISRSIRTFVGYFVERIEAVRRETGLLRIPVDRLCHFPPISLLFGSSSSARRVVSRISSRGECRATLALRKGLYFPDVFRIPSGYRCLQVLSLSILGITVVIVTRGGIHETDRDLRTDCTGSPGALCYTSSSMLRSGICCFCANAFSTYSSWSSFLSITDS